MPSCHSTTFESSKTWKYWEQQTVFDDLGFRCLSWIPSILSLWIQPSTKHLNLIEYVLQACGWHWMKSNAIQEFHYHDIIVWFGKWNPNLTHPYWFATSATLAQIAATEWSVAEFWVSTRCMKNTMSHKSISMCQYMIFASHFQTLQYFGIPAFWLFLIRRGFFFVLSFFFNL